MPVDFDSLVINVGQNTFAIPITVTPTVSQPSVPPYPARGVWTMQESTVLLDDGSQLSTVTLTMSIRLAEFPVWPAPQDTVIVPLSSSAVSAGSYLIDKIQPDGQGAAKLTLKALQTTILNPG